MIEIPQPSIALNALNPISDREMSKRLSAAAGKKVEYKYNTPGTKYDMWQTWDVPESASASWVMSCVSAITPADGVKCLVINCHGFYGKKYDDAGKETGLISSGGFGFGIGQGIDYANAQEFAQLRGKVKCIIIVACGASYVTNPKNSLGGDGELLCSRIARAADAYVIAPKISQQAAYIRLPKNHIDNFEGEVLRFNRAGVVDDSRFLARKLIKDIF